MKATYETENPSLAELASTLSDWNLTVIVVFFEVMFGWLLLQKL